MSHEPWPATTHRTAFPSTLLSVTFSVYVWPAGWLPSDASVPPSGCHATLGFPALSPPARSLSGGQPSMKTTVAASVCPPKQSISSSLAATTIDRWSAGSLVLSTTSTSSAQSCSSVTSRRTGVPSGRVVGNATPSSIVAGIGTSPLHSAQI